MRRDFVAGAPNLVIGLSIARWGRAPSHCWGSIADLVQMVGSSSFSVRTSASRVSGSRIRSIHLRTSFGSNQFHVCECPHNHDDDRSDYHPSELSTEFFRQTDPVLRSTCRRPFPSPCPPRHRPGVPTCPGAIRGIHSPLRASRRRGPRGW